MAFWVVNSIAILIPKITKTKKNSSEADELLSSWERQTFRPNFLKCFKIKIVRIALVAISASKYNYHVMELASHFAQEARCNNKLPFIDFLYMTAI